MEEKLQKEDKGIIIFRNVEDSAEVRKALNPEAEQHDKENGIKE